MSFEPHITFSAADRVNSYEFDLYVDRKREGFQVKLGENYYSIQPKKEEDLGAIQEILKKGIGEKTLKSIEDLTHQLSSLSPITDLRTHHTHHIGITTLSGSSPVSIWSKQEQQLKHDVAELYWKEKVIGEPENSHEGFTGFLSFIAQYDGTIDNQDDRLIKVLRHAIKTGNKEKFIEAFESLPLGMVGMVNHGEGLNAFPPPLKRNPEKKLFTESDLVQLQRYAKETKFSGVICLSDANGIYSLSSHEIFKSDTPFAMHSIGKMFTGMLAIKLIEKGIISTSSANNALDHPIQLDPKVMDKLEEYCPAVKKHLTKEGAPTFRQIMMHQGGLDDYLNNYEAAIQKAIDDKEIIPKIDAPEDFLKYAQDEIHPLKEGETHYSNLGLLLTGLSLQHHYNVMHPTEKKTYQEILEEFVLRPAGITSFTITRPVDGVYNERHEVAAHIQGGPAGGYWITPMDLLKFGQWTAKQCEEPSVFDLVKEYGGEFQPEREQMKNEEDSDSIELSHGGQIDSATSFLGTFLPNGMSIAILSNQPFQAAVLEGAIKDHILSR